MSIVHRFAAAAGLAALSSVAVAGSGYHYLDLGQVTQEHSQWCWAASSVSVLGLYGKHPSQCGVVNWAYGLDDACGNNNFDWNANANSPNNLYGSSGSVEDILASSGISNTAYDAASSWNAIVNDIDAGRPFVMRFGWYSGGGHILVGYGYDDQSDTRYVGYMNPWPGEGFTWSTYSWTVSAQYDHSWTNTLRMRQ